MLDENIKFKGKEIQTDAHVIHYSPTADGRLTKHGEGEHGVNILAERKKAGEITYYYMDMNKMDGFRNRTLTAMQPEGTFYFIKYEEDYKFLKNLEIKVESYSDLKRTSIPSSNPKSTVKVTIKEGYGGYVESFYYDKVEKVLIDPEEKDSKTKKKKFIYMLEENLHDAYLCAMKLVILQKLAGERGYKFILSRYKHEDYLEEAENTIFYQDLIKEVKGDKKLFLHLQAIVDDRELYDMNCNLEGSIKEYINITKGEGLKNLQNLLKQVNDFKNESEKACKLLGFGDHYASYIKNLFDLTTNKELKKIDRDFGKIEKELKKDKKKFKIEIEKEAQKCVIAELIYEDIRYNDNEKSFEAYNKLKELKKKARKR